MGQGPPGCSRFSVRAFFCPRQQEETGGDIDMATEAKRQPPMLAAICDRLEANGPASQPRTLDGVPRIVGNQVDRHKRPGEP